LGWLAVEVFGRLRRYARARPQASGGKSDATRRFNFSDRDLSLTDQLLIAMQQTKAASFMLVPELPPPIPDDPAGWLDQGVEDMDALWGEFESWSRKVWNALQVSNPLAGRAFTYGGSLADTYWYADGAGAAKLSETLRAQRLEHIAARFDAIAEYLPDDSPEVIHHSLYRWRVAHELHNAGEERGHQVLERLEAQAKVWHDLLFGLQPARSYLTVSDRRLISWAAYGATAILVVSVGLIVWLVVLLLTGTGRGVLASATGISLQSAQGNIDLMAELLNWQNWSSILAALSSVVVVLTGFISQLSGWMIAFHKRIYAWLELRRIYLRTYRRWDK
jgi:hypothetical protein